MKKRSFVIIMAALLAIMTEACIILSSNKIYDYVIRGNLIDIFPSEQYEMVIYAYEFDGEKFIPQNNDPQLFFSKINEEIEGVFITFSKRVQDDIQIQIYYATEGNSFDEEHVIVGNVLKGNTEVYLDLPNVQCSMLRVDINGEFELESIQLADTDIKETIVYEEQINVIRFVLIAFLSYIFICVLTILIKKELSNKSMTKIQLLYCAGCFLFYTLWAITQEYNYGPDEYMRYDVSLFLYNNNRLPRGTETINAIWGFSYAHLPTMLCNILSFIPMKLAGWIFGDNSFALLVAARMVSVCCGTGGVYFVIKIANRILETTARWIMIVFVSMIPQYVFLCSYVNNDIVALLGCSMILYAWVVAMQEHWNYKNATILAIGIIICALSYYNSYGWILCSIIFFVVSYLFQNKRDYKGMLKLGSFISIIVLCTISYMFIRHLVLYGDLLGFNTTSYYGELYAIDSLKKSSRVTLQNSGVSLSEMLVGSYNWIETTYKSAIGVFGYMSVYISEYVYAIYTWLFVCCTFSGVWNFVVFCKKKKRFQLDKVLFYCCIISCIIIPIFLSIYNSYTNDFQPQGRYCYPGIIAVALILFKGIDELMKKVKRKEYAYGIIGIYAGLFIAITVSEYFVTYLPS